jgi:hypothetical protein
MDEHFAESHVALLQALRLEVIIFMKKNNALSLKRPLTASC